VDSRVDNIPACEMNGTGDTIKKSGMVRGEYSDQCRSTFGIIAGVDCQFRGTICQQMPGIALDNVIGLGNPVRVGEPFRQLGKLVIGKLEAVFELLLLADNPLITAPLFVAQSQDFFGRFEQVGQQLTLPAVPATRPDGPYLNHGQDQKQPQGLGGFYRLREIQYGFEICQVAFERRCGHQQMIAHEPGHRFRFRSGHP